jgi:hypothetical protein
MIGPKCKQCRMEAPNHKMDCSYRPRLPKWMQEEEDHTQCCEGADYPITGELTEETA